MRPLAYLPLTLLLACADRPLGGSASGDASTGASGGTTTSTTPSTVSDTTPGTSPTTGPATTGPATTGPFTTGPATTTEPATTEPATSTTGGPSTLTTDISTGSDPSGTTGSTPDLPRFMPPIPGLVGCNLTAPPGTGIQGQTTLGLFTGDRAYFGVIFDIGTNVTGSPNLMILSPGADPETEFVGHQGSTGPIAVDLLDTDLYDDWVGEWEFKGSVIDKGMFAAPAVKVTITQLAGNWDAPDPGDPPRVVGTFAGDLSGPFDAVFCDKLNIEIISE